MTIRADRSGFTLIETMIASSIALIILLALAGMFIFCQRLFRITVAEAESSLVMRDVRDKLLFRAGPGLSSGLLTGKASVDGASIKMNWEDESEKPDCIRLVWNTSSGGSKFLNESVTHTPMWFAPAGWFKQNGYWLSQQTWAQTVDLPRIRFTLTSPDDAFVQQTTWVLLPQ